MKSRTLKQWKTDPHFPLYLKCGAILLLFLFSVLIVACGGDTGAAANANIPNLNGPVVTVTVNMNKSNLSPTPTVPNLWCGAWTPQTTPSFNNGKTVITIYGKFTKNTNGNPGGVANATATATILWADGTTEQQTGTTTADGTVSFTVSSANRDADVNRVTLVTIAFTEPGGGSCTVERERAAFFTLIVVTPTPKHQKNGG